MLDIPGYRLHRLDRSDNKGGGLAIYVSNSFSSKVIFQYIDSSWEFLAVKLWNDGSQYNPKILMVVYRRDITFSDNHFSSLNSALDSISGQSSEVIIGGDFNINMSGDSSLKQGFDSLLTERGFELINHEPTRHGTSSATTLDLLISSPNFPPLFSGQCPGVSDHEIVFAAFDIPCPPPNTKKVFRNFTALHHESLIADIANMDWADAYNTADLEVAVLHFSDVVKTLYRRHIPLKSIRFKDISTKILTRPDVALLCELRDMAYGRWKRSKSSSSYGEFRHFRRKAEYTIRALTRATMLRNFEGPLNWRKVSELGIGSKSKAKTQADVNPDEFADFLSHPAMSSSRLDPGHGANPDPHRSAARSHVTAGTTSPDAAGVATRNPEGFAFRNCSEMEVIEALNQIKSNAIGNDEIPVKFLKIIFPFILPTVTHLLNRLLTSSLFPNCWKTGIVTPIPKGTSASTVSDWRPITILPAMSKVFEILVRDQILEHIDNEGLLSDHQSGFRRNHSTCTALVKVVSDIRRLCDNGKKVIHVLLDLKKAFDSVPHDLFVQKLSSLFGFSSSACALVTSYLFGRTQIVRSDGRCSGPRSVLAGVPQGAVLAPLFFSLFINDIASTITNVNFHLYADDLQLYAAAPAADIPRLISSLNDQLERINNWCLNNKLALNPSKTQAILYSPNGSEQLALDPTHHICIQNQIIPFESKYVKNLGLLMDINLSWHSHVDLICSRVYFGLRSLYAVSHHLLPHVRSRLVSALILPLFFYADTAIYPLQSTALIKLQRAYKACLRYVFKLGRHSHISPLNNLLLPGKLHEIFELNMLSFIYRARLGLLPGYIREKLIWSQYDTYRIVLPRFRTHFGGRSLFLVGAVLWNSLPTLVKSAGSLGKFKELAIMHIASQ